MSSEYDQGLVRTSKTGDNAFVPTIIAVGNLRLNLLHFLYDFSALSRQ